MLLCHGQYFGNVITETEITKRFLDVLAGDGLLCFLLADVVGFGGNQGDELDAAFHKEVPRVFGEGLTG